MGVILPMVFSVRLSTGLMVCGLALALASIPFASARAEKAASSASSVEIYVDDASDVMPEGMEWNKPLKAGDMVLPRKTQPKPKKSYSVPSVPKEIPSHVGELKAPVLPPSQAKATPPQLAGKSGSTAGVMLNQGMKNALQQAGQNTDIPKSGVVAPEASPSSITTVSTDASAPVSSAALRSSLGGESASSLSAPVVRGGVAYEPGQEPKAFIAPKGELPATETAEDKATDSDALFETAKGSGPKATEMEEPPPSLAEEIESPSVPSANKAFAGDDVAPTSSIFGEPVKEDDEAKAEDELLASDLGGAKAPSPAKAVCEPSITKWTRDCQDAGYPKHYVGEIVGETRLLCPSGEAKDVWLSNSCAAPVVGGNSGVAVVAPEPRATDLATPPEALDSRGGSPAPAPSVASSAEPQTPTDGVCGVANGLASLGKPAADLCLQGDSSSVTGEGPWRWSCKGRHGGMTVSCAAPVAAKESAGKAGELGKASVGVEAKVEDAKCGLATDIGHESAPTQSLCVKGTASRVNGGGPWTWACSGLNGGQAVACTAQKKTDGACGAASREGSDGMPMRDLCAAGYASAVTGEGPWNWTCSGLYGGAAAMCSAQPKVNAVCGPASAKGSRQAPREGLCHAGTSSAVEGEGPWSWRCVGDHGGATVGCKAAVLQDGACGPAHGSPFAEPPEEGLCAQGSASRVTGLGPWNWTCSGAEGGDTVSCTAALGTKESLASIVSCGAASETPSLFKPTTDLCAAGKASAVGGDGPWTWSCSDEAGHNVACTTLTATEGACGKAANVPSALVPTADLCAAGASGSVEPNRTRTAWQWDCKGSMGGGSVVCSAPLSSETAGALPKGTSPRVNNAEALCGTAAGQPVASAPESDLCAAGKAGTVRGAGPWTWTCSGPGKNGARVICESPLRLDAVCGMANGSIQRTAPDSRLCAAGEATAVSGSGPWTWSCIGSEGGASVSCSALAQSQTKVDGTCGAAANNVMASAPEVNLCDSGNPSPVYGDGPWTWTCSGLNGGIASTCSTSRVVPKAPPPPGPLVNGLCGPMNGVATTSAPEEGLCSSGAATAISGDGPWNWSCIGVNGGMTVSCTSPLMPPAPIVGVCGASSGVPTITAPKSALCSSGISSAVSGKGPWTWSCSGTNGGGAVSCVAPLAGGSSSGGPLPSLTTPSLDGEAPAPKASPAGLVTPSLPSGPLPPIDSGKIPNRKSSKPSPSRVPEVSEIPAPSLADLASPPAKTPSLPEEVKGLNPPPLRDSLAPTPGLKPPVIDSEGQPVPGARLVLEAELSTISFVRGSDQLDKEAVKVVEKLANIMLIHGNARITLVGYSDTNGDISPREARKLSLNRVLAIRDFLASKGVSSSRVDVRPMGANVPSGDMDRVDVKAN